MPCSAMSMGLFTVMAAGCVVTSAHALLGHEHGLAHCIQASSSVVSHVYRVTHGGA